ncbi:MAG TPA: T9SS type A sorting domain-containing protein [Ignavibacteriaceae bacterium]|nr:T9SS type A sorting domain-containing protein [Ignavibacteriaceae bacterium]
MNITNSSYCLITENLFTFTSGDKCILAQANEDPCTYNVISNNIVNGGTLGDDYFKNGDFIQIGREDDGSNLVSENSVEYNTVILQNSCVGASNNYHHSDMVQFYRLKVDDVNTIKNNYFWWKGTRIDGYTVGIDATGSTSNPGGILKIYNNIFFFQTTGKGAIMVDNGSNGNIIVKVWNNTFYVAQDWQMDNNDSFIYITRAGTNINHPNEFINNIFADYSDAYSYNGSTFKLTTINFSSNFSSGNLILNDNLYYAPNKGTYDTWLIYNGNNCYSKNMDCWRTQTGQEANGYYGDPIFGTKYTPQLPDGDSPNDFIAWNVSDSGTVLFTEGTNPPPEFLIDFNGCYRDMYWNRGAFEEGDRTAEIPGMEKINNKKIKEFLLVQNYPNPFNPTTTISYSLPSNGFTTLKVYDMLGNEVATLVNEDKQFGNYVVEFNASNLSSGVYFYSLTSGSFTMNKKMILMK